MNRYIHEGKTLEHIRPQPGDLLVLRYAHGSLAAQQEAVQYAVDNPIPGVKWLVLPDGMSLEKVPAETLRAVFPPVVMHYPPTNPADLERIRKLAQEQASRVNILVPQQRDDGAQAERQRCAALVEAAEPWIGKEWADRLAEEIRGGINPATDSVRRTETLPPGGFFQFVQRTPEGWQPSCVEVEETAAPLPPPNNIVCLQDGPGRTIEIVPWNPERDLIWDEAKVAVRAGWVNLGFLHGGSKLHDGTGSIGELVGTPPGKVYAEVVPRFLADSEPPATPALCLCGEVLSNHPMAVETGPDGRTRGVAQCPLFGRVTRLLDRPAPGAESPANPFYREGTDG